VNYRAVAFVDLGSSTIAERSCRTTTKRRSVKSNVKTAGFWLVPPSRCHSDA
jgi:hypothetical protein